MTTQPLSDDLVRPIIGIENRTAQEAFDIMADRFRARLKLHAEQAAEIQRLREVLGDIFDHFADRSQGPGHSHTVPGIWDDDRSNLELRGLPCEWCAKWERARTALNRKDKS
jgi:hypothetical protein